MNENYIESEIMKRKIIYYPISDSDLGILRSKSIWSDIFMILTSLCLSVFMSAIMTKYISVGVSEDFLNILGFTTLFSGILLVVFLGLTLIFNISSKKQIKGIKFKNPERLEISEFDKKPNPKHYLGNRKIIMNIKISNEGRFLLLFHGETKYNQLKSQSHANKIKTEHFTFIIENGNKELYGDFQKFLVGNKIDFMDYK